MAGLAAARALRDLHIEPLVVEAASRVGGRALTDTTSLGGVFDRGAGWLHSSDKNPLAPLATVTGLRVEHLALRELVYRDGSGWLSPSELTEWTAYRDTAYAQIHRAAAASRDAPVSAVVDRHPKYWRVLEGWFADDEGTRPDTACIADVAAYRDTGKHARIREGLGTLVRQYAHGLPVCRGVRVTGLDWSGPGVKLYTTHGYFQARAAIVTVSTAVLAHGAIAFTPALPAATLSAIRALPLAIYEKVGMQLRGAPLVDEPAWVLSLADSVSVALEVQPAYQPQIVAYLNGPELALQPPQALWDIARERVVAMFGANAAARVVAWHATQWSSDALIGGSYSYALTGKANSRSALAAPLEDRLVFAGEACSQTAYGTLHGAYLSGRAAAHRVARVRI
jgi:monoamine oxidase